MIMDDLPRLKQGKGSNTTDKFKQQHTTTQDGRK
jgi:hypothetical protein